MAKIGILQTGQRDMKTEYEGHIRTLEFSLKIRLTTNTDVNSSATSPDFIVMAKSPDGEETEIGAAWLRTPNNRDSAVKEFLSIQIDDPSMAEQLNVVAFPKDNGTWDITFRRRAA